MTTKVVFSCYHAVPQVKNTRAEVLGRFLFDLKPDLVIDLGDGADMRSLSSYDERYPKQVVTESYEKDIESYNDAQDRMRHWFRHSKRKKPFWVGFEGNHENRIKKALATDPRIEGQKYGISFKHLQTDKWFNEYHEYAYGSPCISDYYGVSYAHYFTAYNSPRAIAGINHARRLTQVRGNSSTCGHSHRRGLWFNDDFHPKPNIGTVVGCLKGKDEDWAGQSQFAWWRGIVVKHNCQPDGTFDPQFISLESLEKEYA